jgi:uncharacterized protein (TIGR03437 family)
MDISLNSSSAHVRVPVLIFLRPGQVRAPFEVKMDAAALRGQATLTAQLGNDTLETPLTVLPAPSPTLTVSTRQTGKPGSSIRFQANAADGYDQPLTVTASGMPSKASFDTVAGDFVWIPSEADLGVHQVFFTATDSLGHAATKTVTIDIGSGLPEIAELKNAAPGYAVPACTPGSRARLVGSFLAGDNGRTHVLVNGESATVVQASSSRVDFVCPSVPAGTALDIAVETPAGRSKSLLVAMADAAPGILTVSGADKDQALASIGNSALLAAVPNPDTAGQPAEAGDLVSLQVSGIGCNESLSARQAVLSLGTQIAEIRSIAPADGVAGICRISATVPTGVYGDSVPLTLRVLRNDGTPVTSNTAFLAVGN